MEPNSNSKCSDKGDDLIEQFYQDMKKNNAIELDYHEEDKFDQQDHSGTAQSPERALSVDSDFEDEHEEETKEELKIAHGEFQDDNNYDNVLQEMMDLVENKPKLPDQQSWEDEPPVENHIELYSNEYKPKKRKKIKLELLEPMTNPEFTVLNREHPHPSSIFCKISKIDKDSLYDTVDKKNKTRFSNLPKKAPKGNLPVTFHKKIKSSGYGTKPEALKYSKMKQKKKPESKLFVTRD